MDRQKLNNKRVILHLSLLSGIGPATVFKLLRGLYNEQFPDLLHGGWMEVFNALYDADLGVLYDRVDYDFVRLCGLADGVAQQLVDGLKHVDIVDKELELAQRHGITIATIFDTSYPEILKSIYAPPLVLYYKGVIPHCGAKRISFVGSRKATAYAAAVTDQLVCPLVEMGWEIVSGGAEGADTMAHQAALKYGGVTRAILGSGLLSPYPLSNVKLFENIAQCNGTVISPFPLTFPPDRGNFPARNRIIAGLSVGCVVVQAAAKSGALITAQYALDQGRQVFAVPGLMTEELSAGCHSLIKHGAKLVNGVVDILEEFGESYIPKTGLGLQSKMVKVGQDYSLLRGAVLSDATVVKKTTSVDPILQYLTQPQSLDELLVKTGFEFGELQSYLFKLNLEGKVRQNFVGMWESVGE